jgi:hypothetical protein
VLSQTPIFTPLWIALNPPQQLSGRASALNFNPFRNITQAAIKRLFLEKILDRQIVYPGAIPLETDLLNTNKYSMIGAAKLAHTILGDGPWLQGLACTANSPAALNVIVAAGQIYSLQNIDGTAYSSLAADTAHTILKQGILLDAVTLSTPAPATAGQSVNYLVQIAYTDTDSGATVLPYYNSSNPSQAYSGPNNSGAAQNTVRKGVCSVLVKTGIAATTGTQVTPAPDSGYIGAYVVTVANGQTTVTAVNIVTLAGAPFITETLTNKISYQSGDARYGKLSGATFTGPISAPTVTATGQATALRLVAYGAGAVTTNSAVGAGALLSNTTGTYNTANGVSALLSNTTGANNTADGMNALLYNTTGSQNTACGVSALRSNTTGVQNTACGEDSLVSNTTGVQNTACGVDALLSNTTGYQNTACGQGALLSNTTGFQNTACGVSALQNNTAGIGNTANGFLALQNNTTGSGNTAINPLNSAGVYAPVFAPVAENDRLCMGSTGVTNAYVQVAWTVVSDARDKINFSPVPHGLEFVKALQPTAYQFRTARDSEETNGGVRYGFKAQDVLALEGDNPVIVDNDDADKLRMIETALVPVLVKALQELNAKFDAYVLTHP